MEKITSRKNQYIASLRALARDAEERRARGEFVLCGEKLLLEAMDNGAAVTSVLWAGEPTAELACPAQYTAPAELVDYASPVKDSPGPVFTVAIPADDGGAPMERAIVLESVQDPGNVGTVVRTADALGVDAVILVDGCADLYSPKTARATMGAVFRQRVIRTSLAALPALLGNLPLYAAALRPGAEDIRGVSLSRCAVAVGNEGGGLTEQLLALCEKTLIIPMSPRSESLNAAMAAGIIMWEMIR